MNDDPPRRNARRDAADVSKKPGWRLLTLALGGFVMGTGTFAVVGLLQEMADDLKITIPQAGNLITAHFIGIVVGSPLLMAWGTQRRRQRDVLVALMLTFALALVAATIAPSYHLLLAARFFSGLPMGAFFGFAAIVAGRLADPGRRARAMALVLLGMTSANVLGVPAATLLGQVTHWRASFGVIAGLAVAATCLLGLLPPVTRVGPAPNVRAEVVAMRRPAVWATVLIGVLGTGTLFASYSFISPMLTEVAGYAHESITALLIVFGAGMTVGNLVGARLADWDPDRGLAIVMCVNLLTASVVLATLNLQAVALVALFAFAVSTSAVVPNAQVRIVIAAPDAPHMAIGCMHAAFNLSNSGVAAVSGALMGTGLGMLAPSVVAVGVAVLGVATALVVHRARPGTVPRSLEAAIKTRPTEA